MAYAVATPTESSADGADPIAVRCEADCNGHGECLPGGRCRCAAGYTGEACEEREFIFKNFLFHYFHKLGRENMRFKCSATTCF